MQVKELRQSLRRASFVYPFICIHLFAIAAVFFEFKFSIKTSSPMPGIFIWNPEQIGPFWWVAMGICGIIMPLAGLFLMPQEIEEGNHEMLLLTTINRWQIVFGKFLTLWLLSLLTLTSLLPYIIIRYFIGGIEWFNEIANTGTVISIAAILSAISIAASGYPTLPKKLGIFCVMLFSAVGGGGISMLGGGIWMNMAKASKWAPVANTFYHACVLIVVVSYVILGLLVARSRLRLAVMNFEIKPSSLLVIIIGLAPFIVGMCAAFTCGFGSILGTVLLTFLAWNSDRTPKAPKWMVAPKPNIPPPLPISGTEFMVPNSTPSDMSFTPTYDQPMTPTYETPNDLTNGSPSESPSDFSNDSSSDSSSSSSSDQSC
jgi:ABC-type transport system involved in multi-copper enzyme maturation permease subunit